MILRNILLLLFGILIGVLAFNWRQPAPPAPIIIVQVPEPEVLDFSSRGTLVETARTLPQRVAQADVVREMREANYLANEALWDARLLRYDPVPTARAIQTLPTTIGAFDPGEYLRQFQQLQALQGIEYELRHLRQEHRPRYY